MVSFVFFYFRIFVLSLLRGGDEKTRDGRWEVGEQERCGRGEPQRGIEVIYWIRRFVAVDAVIEVMLGQRARW